MSLGIDDIEQFMQRQGGALYGGEAVSQLEHALQAAHLAEQAGEPAQLITAALLHDLGHLIEAERPAHQRIDKAADVDGLHEFIVLPFLRGTFDASVLEPIRLHVQAKRYLCLIEPSYWGALSDASKYSLEQQGGVFSQLEGEKFIAQPHADSAVRLRRYDDLAKTPGAITPPWLHFRSIMSQAVL